MQETLSDLILLPVRLACRSPRQTFMTCQSNNKSLSSLFECFINCHITLNAGSGIQIPLSLFSTRWSVRGVEKIETEYEWFSYKLEFIHHEIIFLKWLQRIFKLNTTCLDACRSNLSLLFHADNNLKKNIIENDCDYKAINHRVSKIC